MKLCVTDSPRRALKEANAIAPQPSDETTKAMEIAKKKRKRVQAKDGEVLTTPAVLKQLKDEAEIRACKLTARRVKSQRNLLKQMEDAKDDDEENNEGDNGEESTACLVCGRLWKTYTKRGEWLICDICDQYVCPKCVPKEIDYEDDFFCQRCSS